MSIPGLKRYYRILTPLTIDGINQKTDPETEKVIYVTSYAPITRQSKEHFERENSKLPVQLRHKITEETDDVPVNAVDMKAKQIAAAKAFLKSLGEDAEVIHDPKAGVSYPESGSHQEPTENPEPKRGPGRPAVKKELVWSIVKVAEAAPNRNQEAAEAVKIYLWQKVFLIFFIRLNQ